MTATFLTTALRNLLRHKLQSLINLASLAIGLAVFGFALLYVKRELSVDAAWPDNDRVHRLTIEQKGIPGSADGTFNSVLARAYPNLTEYFAEHIEHATRVATTGTKIKDSEVSIYRTLWFVDPGFTDILQVDVVEGSLERVLSAPGYIAISDTRAEQWGAEAKVGGRLMLETSQGFAMEYEVAAIYRLPRPVSNATTVDAFTLIHDYSRPLFGTERPFIPWEGSVQVWLKLRSGVETAAFNVLQPAFVQQEVTAFNEALGPQRKISDHLFYRWQSLRDIYFNPVGFEAANAVGGNMARVLTFAAVGLLVLLVGCSNSVSLSLAAALARRREIGIRKAAGALAHDIRRHQLGESMLLALLALVPAIGLIEWLQPAFQTLLRFGAPVSIGWRDYLLLAAIAAGVGLVSGAYPALVLSGTRPQAVLRAGAQESGKGGLNLRTLLVGVQFCLASMLLIGTAALYLQLAVARAQRLGFDTRNLVYVFAGSGSQSVSYEALQRELAKLPGVVSAIPAMDFPNSGITSNVMNLVRYQDDTEEVGAQYSYNGFGFTEAVGIRLLAGRDFDSKLDTFNRETRSFPDGQLQRLVLNHSAIRALGFAGPDEAVGQTIYSRAFNSANNQMMEEPQTIIGVVEDSQYRSTRRRPGPEVLRSIGSIQIRGAFNFLVKYEPDAEATIEQSLRDTVKRVNGVPTSSLMFIEPQVEAAFRQESNESRLLMICGSVALLLACIGLYGLAATMMMQRIKEVGVRKALGAHSAAIVGLFLWRFAKPILVANLLAWPMAIYFVLQWIERFPYQLERGWLLPLCAGTSLVVLLIAVLTTGVLTTRAATTAPVRSLRYE